jgi:hypothetical protein
VIKVGIIVDFSTEMFIFKKYFHIAWNRMVKIT